MPGDALHGLMLQASRCPHCRKTGVFVMNPFSAGWASLAAHRGLLRIARSCSITLAIAAHTPSASYWHLRTARLFPANWWPRG